MALTDEIQKFKTLKAQLIDDMPELADDPECLLDTLDGLTDVKEILAAIIRSASIDKANAKACGELVTKMKNRKKAQTDRAERKRNFVHRVMNDLGIKKVIAPDHTFYESRGVQSVRVTSVDELPSTLVETIRKPMLSLIKDELKRGIDIPGATLSNGAPRLTVR